MSDGLARGFMERFRFGRQEELARLARDQHADLSLVLGLSWQASGNQKHFDYAGGLNTNRIRTRLAKLAKPTQWEAGSNSTGGAEKDDAIPSFRNALIDAAPVEIRQNAAIERKRRSERKHRDYSGILSQIDTEAIASFALSIRQARHNLTPTRRASPPQLPRVDGPLFGSAHLLYSIDFYGVQGREAAKWIVKIPVDGTPDTWDRLCTEALRTEALVLFMLRTETSMPVPEIIDADPSPHNEIHVPYLIMEYVEGLTLDRIWYGEGHTEGETRRRRTRVLQGLAEAMLQLGKYEFEHGGSPIFDSGRTLFGVGPMRELDIQAMIDRWLDNEDCEKSPVYVGIGPFGDSTKMYTELLDLYPCGTEAQIGVDRLLRLLLGFIREPSRLGPRDGEEEKRFVLTHPNLSMRDVIVSQEGHIKAILGWDGVRAAPRSLGNEAFPPWLIRDLNPFIWRWRPRQDFWKKGHYNEPEENRYEDAPWILAELRQEYTNIVQKLRNKKTETGTDVDMDIDVTKQSLMSLSLDAAVRDPRCRADVLRRILEKCSRRSEEFDFSELVGVLGNGRHLEGHILRCLEENFKELIDRGYVRGATVW